MSWAKVLSLLKLPVRSEHMIRRTTLIFVCDYWAMPIPVRQFSRREFTRFRSSWDFRSAYRRRSWAITDGSNTSANVHFVNRPVWFTRITRSSSSWTQSTLTSRSHRWLSRFVAKSSRLSVDSPVFRQAPSSAKSSSTVEVNCKYLIRSASES